MFFKQIHIIDDIVLNTMNMSTLFDRNCTLIVTIKYYFTKQEFMKSISNTCRF